MFSLTVGCPIERHFNLCGDRAERGARAGPVAFADTSRTFDPGLSPPASFPNKISGLCRVSRRPSLLSPIPVAVAAGDVQTLSTPGGQQLSLEIRGNPALVTAAKNGGLSG